MGERECVKCGRADCGKHCLAKRRQGDGWCQLDAGWGTDHVGVGRCKLHGGSTTSHTNSRRVVEAKAAKELAQLGYEPVEDPIGEMLDLAGRFKALEGWLATKVAELDDKGHLRYEGHGQASSEQLRAEVAMWERMLDRFARVLEALARLNLEERRIRLSEAQTELLAKVIDATLADPVLALSADQRRAAPAAIARHIDAVALRVA